MRIVPAEVLTNPWPDLGLAHFLNLPPRVQLPDPIHGPRRRAPRRYQVEVFDRVRPGEEIHLAASRTLQDTVPDTMLLSWGSRVSGLWFRVQGVAMVGHETADASHGTVHVRTRHSMRVARYGNWYLAGPFPVVGVVESKAPVPVVAPGPETALAGAP